MKTRHLQDFSGRNGVALVIVLGLLAVLTLMAVSFAIAMRVERMAARNYANGVRAEFLVESGVGRAMAFVDNTMTGKCYPNWRAGAGTPMDAVSSSGTSSAPNLLTGEALSLLPGSLFTDANAAAATSRWQNVVENGITNGRIAYLILNCSGLVDPNWVCGAARDFCTNVNELDPSGSDLGMLKPWATTNDFLYYRTKDRRYETVPELDALNDAVADAGSAYFSWFPYSFDPDRDKYFPNKTGPWPNSAKMDTSTMGTRAAMGVLSDKFRINSITNYTGYSLSWDYDAYKSDGNFMTNYFKPLTELLSNLRLLVEQPIMERPTDVGWNIVNWLDPDRIPQGDQNLPFRHTEGGEAIPLINEIVLDKVTGGASNTYEFSVELWYPYAPTVVKPEDNFWLWIGVYSNQYTDKDELPTPTLSGAKWPVCPPPSSAGPPAMDCITDHAMCSSTNKIDNMVYKTSTEFLVFKSPKFTLSAPLGETNGFGVMQKVWFLSRVYKGDTNAWCIPPNYIWNPVDEAMGYDNPSDGDNQGGSDPTRRRLKEFTNTVGHSVCDPRSNGQVKYWSSSYYIGAYPSGGLGPYPASGAGSYSTLGTTNYCQWPWFPTEGSPLVRKVDPFHRKGSGTPIYSKNGPMLNIGELGYVFRSNLDGEDTVGDFWWRTIDLMHYDEGAALLDWVTVRETNSPSYGLISANSKQTPALATLLNKLNIGYTTSTYTAWQMLDFSGDIDPVVIQTITSNSVNPGFISFRSMFTAQIAPYSSSGGKLAERFRDCALNHGLEGDIFKEDTFRKICEMITFRQNVFVIVLAAQAFGPDGATVVGEKRAVATVYRDSYTGRYFIRSFKWLSDRT